MSAQTGWTDDVEVDFEGTPDELVNLEPAVYVFDISKAEPKKTAKGKQAISVAFKAASVVGGGEIPKGAKQIYETVLFDPENLFTAKNLLKSAGVELPKRINFETLEAVCAALIEAGQVLGKTAISEASGGFQAKARISRFYSQASYEAAQAGAEGGEAAPEAAGTRPRRGARAA
jgi:hypothetical protein